MSKFLAILTAIPKIFDAIKSLFAAMKKYLEDQKNRKNADAIKKLKEAKTEEEQKDATRDLANNP